MNIFSFIEKFYFASEDFSKNFIVTKITNPPAIRRKIVLFPPERLQGDFAGQVGAENRPDLP